MTTTAIRPVTPLLTLALRSFGRARTALRKGCVDEMIGQLTRGVDCLEVIDRQSARAVRRRASRAS